MTKIKYYILLLIIFASCKDDGKDSEKTLFQLKESKDSEKTLFQLKNNKAIGINFENTLAYDKDFNVYKYRNFYNGGGVGLGDINNDGLIDVYMVSNQKENKLYLNKGDWKFEDISIKSKTGGTRSWSTGVAMVDVNSDGWLDIYVCNSGDVKGDNKENELFINNGDLTFTESAEKYGLNDKGYSTHASFFDYDKDGDLDCYILNNSFRAIGSFDLRKNQRNTRDELGGDKLMRNDNGKFVDVSNKAGIFGSEIGFGLGITIGDVNNDNWEDIFISNDFFERDYLYINQKNGTFKEDIVNQMNAISAASMGADIADINNDGWNDIFVTDMLPSDYSRLKTLTTFDDWNRYNLGVSNGYHNQFTRNVLHLNNGNNTFSEVSRLTGVEASDWSWGALIFDMDNDGLKDLFIANGIYKDLTNQDYLQYVSNQEVMLSIMKDSQVDYKKLIDIIPSNPVPNHAYKNNGNLQFSKYTTSGLWTEGFSNGSAYGDIDNDGDLDLVVNNINSPCFVYENKSNENRDNKYLKIVLKGEKQNINAIGAKIIVTTSDKSLLAENQPMRGFESSMDTRVNIGVGKADSVDVKVIWPSGKSSVLKDIKTNQTLTLNEVDGLNVNQANQILTEKSQAVFEKQDYKLNYIHKENQYNDFNRENLSYHMLSTRGPCASLGDVNGDGKNDIVIPGSKGAATKIFLHKEKDEFSEQIEATVFTKLKEAEHIKSMLFDADNDGDNDLLLASGGVEVTEFSDVLYDELLINDGKGNFTSSGQKLPKKDHNISTGAIANADIDNDGDKDLFIGERVKIGKYGALCSGYILINDGKGKFTDKTNSLCPELIDIGMITDAEFSDLDNDGKIDLIVIGEFMDVHIFKNTGNKFKKADQDFNLKGWWNEIMAMDIDNDKDLDLVLGNHGLNSRFKASKEMPIKLYHSDFDNNGSFESILTKKFEDGKFYPYHLRHSLLNRLPGLKKKFQDFESFKKADIESIFSKDQLKSAKTLEVVELKSLILVNNGNMKFEVRELPSSVQYSCMYAIEKLDVNKDGYYDIIMGGNLYNVQPEMGRYDASYGHILINNKKGQFTDESKRYNFSVKGEIRSIIAEKDYLYIFRNNDSALSYKINHGN